MCASKRPHHNGTGRSQRGHEHRRGHYDRGARASGLKRIITSLIADRHAPTVGAEDDPSMTARSWGAIGVVCETDFSCIAQRDHRAAVRLALELNLRSRPRCHRQVICRPYLA